MDKAGAYGVQEWIGFIGVENISGSYYNIMGLPVQRLYKELCLIEGEVVENSDKPIISFAQNIFYFLR